MTPQQINRAIAKACGWTVILESCSDKIGNFWGGYSPTDPHNWIPIPDYCNDLNAMHEAEETLFEEGRIADYSAQLYWLSVPKLAQHDDHFHDHIVTGYIATASAAQRAEAFLWTIGKWEDGK